MTNARICEYSHSDHELPHWKCVLQCCAKFPIINLLDQETDDQYPNTSPSISFHVYHLIGSCTKHGRLPLTDKEICCKLQHDTASGQLIIIYTRKELVMMETIISNFCTSSYIPEIQKLAFHIPHVQILGMNHCGDSRWNAFKRCESFQGVLCCFDCAKRVVASFVHKIQSEYYGGNISMSI